MNRITIESTLKYAPTFFYSVMGLLIQSDQTREKASHFAYAVNICRQSRSIVPLDTEGQCLSFNCVTPRNKALERSRIRCLQNVLTSIDCKLSRESAQASQLSVYVLNRRFSPSGNLETLFGEKSSTECQAHSSYVTVTFQHLETLWLRNSSSQIAGEYLLNSRVDVSTRRYSARHALFCWTLRLKRSTLWPFHWYSLCVQKLLLKRQRCRPNTNNSAST